MSRLGQTSTVKQVLRDLAALVARVAVGGIFFANGWTKLEDGLNITEAKFLQQGAPAPGAWAPVTMLTELVGGALLIAGLAVSTTGLILFAEALLVFLVAPPLNPITMNELILLGAASLLLAVVGAGRVSVDHMVVIRRRESEAASEFAADTEADRVIASLRDPDRPADAPPEESPSPEVSPTEDTAPHPRPRAQAAESRRADDPIPAPGDTLVAGRKKPPPRGRRPSTD
ncbi:DoxX family protein [Nonomuraea sp. SYSU D8015]|uniref:DoxX family protein n=1 Tax=Nonomuraea sp. SYSU D8015 TaxID=2593644 RepID=UPI001CB6B8B2|nr:DoxX family protein [Nonomuraea sp. SYSU D8015]